MTHALTHTLAEPERHGATTLTDGRRLGWAEWGPACRHHVLPEAGGSLLWTHAELILTALMN